MSYHLGKMWGIGRCGKKCYIESGKCGGGNLPKRPPEILELIGMSC
jgi:hypothetical protein